MLLFFVFRLPLGKVRSFGKFTAFSILGQPFFFELHLCAKPKAKTRPSVSIMVGVQGGKRFLLVFFKDKLRGGR